MSYDITDRAIHPLGDLFQALDFPLADFIPAETLNSFFAGLYFTEARTVVEGKSVAIEMFLAFEKELSIGIPGVPDLEVIIGYGGTGWTVIETRLTLGAQSSIELVDVPIALKVPKRILKNVQSQDDTIIDLATVTLKVGTDGSVLIDTNAAITLPECEIAGSGVTVSATDVGWNFEHGQTLPQATSAGLTGEFLGIAFKNATLKLPPDLLGGIQMNFDYCCFGTGGFTGGVQATPTAANPWRISLGGTKGFTVDLTRVALRFQQSRLVMGEIDGVLRGLPFFNGDVAVALQLTVPKELKITLSPEKTAQLPGTTSSVDSTGLLVLRKPGIVSMALTSATLDVSGSEVALSLSGSITPEVGLPGGGRLPGFKVDALTITSSGKVSVGGGWITMPKSSGVSLGPFKIQITRAGLGSGPSPGEHWAGFSGTLSLVEGVPITATLDGLKVKWDDHGLIGVELAGVALSLTVEGVLKLDGSIKYDSANQRFDGSGTLQLVALNLTTSVKVVIGRRADYNYLYLYLLLQPPVGVPIFNTGLAFYSFEALYARNMEPDKSPQERWFKDWYLRQPIGAVATQKWVDRKDDQAFGAGLILGTLADKGYSIGVKGLLIVIVPGPVLMLEAKANVLKNPAELADPAKQALFDALIVYDGRAGTFEADIQPHYVYPDDGGLVDVTGIAEAFYSFNDPRAWHVYLGRKNPPDRIRAKLFSIFEANFYLMLQPDSLEIGGYIGYNKKFSAGPVELAFQSYIDGSAIVSWRPEQAKGVLDLQGAVRLSICGVGLGVSISAELSAEAPKPLVLDASVHVKVDLPWPIPGIDVTAHLHWEGPAPPRVTVPLQSVGIEHIQSKVSWPLDGSNPTVPLDGRLSIAFDRAINDYPSVGTNATQATDLQIGGYLYRSSISDIELQRFDVMTGAWVTYAAADGNPKRLYGMWQSASGDNGQGNRRLMLWVRTPYEWSRPLSDPSTTQLEQAEGFSPCEPMAPTRMVDFDDQANTSIPPSGTLSYAGLNWVAGFFPALIEETDQAVGGLPIVNPLPRRYYRGLYLPDQFLLTTVPGPGGSYGGGGSSNPPPPPLSIHFSQPMKGVAMLCLAVGMVGIEGFDAAGNSVASEVLNLTPLPEMSYRVLQLSLRSRKIRRIDVTCDYRIILLALAIQGAPNDNDVSVAKTAMEQTLERFKDEEPLLDSHTSYRLHVVTTIVEMSGKSLVGADVEQPNGAQVTISGNSVTVEQNFEFKTEGPPGDSQLSSPGANPDSSPDLDTLHPYVGLTIPAQGARGVYRGYDLGVAFNADYVDQMYRANVDATTRPNGQTLVLKLKGDQGDPITLSNTLGKGNQIVLRREEKTWRETLNRSTCQLTIADSDIVHDIVLTSQTQGTVLGPNRRYDTFLAADPPGQYEIAKPLHQWSFVTSRYFNFADHFTLRYKIREAPITSPSGRQWIANATPALLAGDPWQATGPERDRRRAIEITTFQTLFAGIQAEANLPADLAVHEVTTTGATKQIWAVLLSSPEPFNWDRLSVSAQQISQGSPPLDLQICLIRDSDLTRAFIILQAGPYGALWLQGSHYRLNAVFKHDLGGGSPVLSQGGVTTDEQVTLDLQLQ